MEESRVRQRETVIRRYGKDFYKVNARKGGLKVPTKFTSATGRAAAQKRWEKQRKKQAKKQGGSL